MTGAQAQLLSAAQTSLWARVRDLEIADVEKAMNNRTLVKASCMRRTLFLVPARELAIFVRGAARRAEKEIRWALGKGVAAHVIETAIETTLRVLDEPLTRPEIADRVSRALGVQIASYEGGGWGNRRSLAAVPVGHLNYPTADLLHLVGARGVVCYGPPRGNEPTFVRADAWIPNWRDLSPEEAETRLLHKYLQAFGPATAADFAMWSGINLTDARETWRRTQSDLASVDVEGWEAAVLRRDLDALAQAGLKSPHVRLLPYFDTFLLGHREREHLVSKQYHPNVFRPQGWIAPVVLVDGRVAGVWEHAREGHRLHVKVTKFGSLSRAAASALREEADDLGRFLGMPNVDVHLDWLDEKE
jgi:hypothetical protein